MPKSLFEVNGKDRYRNNKKMTVSVYGVRTSTRMAREPGEAEFLVYFNGKWVWMNADNYTPIDNKHG
ncbi:hypothetical protein [Ruminiclostridium papyrosolvens]|uniref:Uncharacterized protein n=1 Tax=Ruminiclostridium papyrosolvens C7 TaxID=1330534 RepID=U4R2E2_9FIRM|nr:hypothetical protein [Ruminiclostridium papyrosolvens]EPR12375.1 hypothetical protein L323_08765 [Ruminiclostridium papyrosolvens C7]